MTSVKGAAPVPPVVLLVSAGSSGSHLLATRLASYRPFVTGPELNIAGRTELFQVASFHTAVLKGLLRVKPEVPPLVLSDGEEFDLVPRAFLTRSEAYGIGGSIREKIDFLGGAADWGSFVARLSQVIAQANGFDDRPVVVEHSPSAARSALWAMRKFDGVRVVHLVRDPRDAIASMMARRRKLERFAALSVAENLEVTARQWLFLSTAALRAQREPGYLRVRYEDLVRDDAKTIERVIAHLLDGVAGQPGEAPWLLDGVERREGWTASPSSEVTTRSIGRYRHDLSSDELDWLNRFSIEMPDTGQRADMRSLIRTLGYEA